MSKIEAISKEIENIIQSSLKIVSNTKISLSFHNCNITLDFDNSYLNSLTAKDITLLVHNINLPKIISEKKNIHLLIKENSIIPKIS